MSLLCFVISSKVLELDKSEYRRKPPGILILYIGITFYLKQFSYDLEMITLDTHRTTKRLEVTYMIGFSEQC